MVASVRDSGQTAPFGLLQGPAPARSLELLPLMDNIAALGLLTSADPEEISEETWARIRSLHDSVVPENSTAMRRLALFLNGNAGPELTDDDAEELEKAIKSIWPDIKGVTTEALVLLRRGLLGAEASVPYHQGYAFVALGCKRAQRKKAKIIRHVQRTLKLAQVAVGNNPRCAQNLILTHENKVELVISSISMIQDIKDRLASMAEKFGAKDGRPIVAFSADDMYLRLALSDDKDEFRLYLDQLMLSYSSDLGNVCKDLTQRVDVCLKVFRDLLEALASN